MINTIDETFSPAQWNTLATHPMQSWEWGEVRNKEGKKIVRFVEYGKKDEATAVYLMTTHPLPHTAYSIGYIPKSTPPSKEFLTYLKSYAQEHRLIFVKLEPNTLSDSAFSTQNSALIESKHPLFTPWNQVLDISLSEEDILKNMYPKTRYNIRLAEKKGVQVHEMTSDNGYQIFEKLYFETCARQKYRGHTRTYHRNIWRHLGHPCSPSLRGSALGGDEAISSIRLSSRLLVAFYKDVPLAAYQVWNFKDTLFYVYGGSSEAYKNVMAANLLMWETIRLAKQLGCKTLDMWGSLPPTYDTKDPWAGFTKFKQGYGTKFVQYAGSYDLVVNSFLYKLYSLAQNLRQKFML
jgi:lipid II:glycine glycyltransferase (peptidoglycan interpeptide bridge formation enzyme)